MGKDRGLELKQRVLAKLMLLEYLKPEFFRQLARVQASESGKPRELATAERTVNEPPPEDTAPPKPSSPKRPRPADPDTAIDAHPWLADEWMRRWLSAEPLLADVDLRPYFYIAHDKVGATDAVETRLSPAARTVLQRLTASGDATQAVGMKDAATLGSADITAVFEVLTSRIRSADTDDARKQITTVMKLAETRPELIPQVVAMLGTLPDGKISLALPMTLATVVSQTPNAALVRPLLARWKASSAKGLPASAAAADERLQ